MARFASKIAIARRRQPGHYSGMAKAPFTKPAYWSDAPPPQPQAMPTPKASDSPAEGTDSPDGLSPTRYGDWVRKGIAIDF